MAERLPIVGAAVAAKLERFGWVEGRDFLVSPPPADSDEGITAGESTTSIQKRQVRGGNEDE